MIKQLENLMKLFSFRGKKFSVSIRRLVGYTPRNIALYQLALLHKSLQKKSITGDILSNERLEFLGDAILGAVIANELYKLFPDEDEGSLTKMRSRIVNRSLLNQVGLKMGLDQIIQLQSQVDLSQTHILGDAVEAIIGAVFIDHGFYKTRKFVLDKIITPHFNIFEIALKDSNYKSLIIEWGQKLKKTVRFDTEEIAGEGENPNIFLCKVFIDDEILGEGSGTSKKEAQQNSARVAYKRIHSH